MNPIPLSIDDPLRRAALEAYWDTDIPEDQRESNAIAAVKMKIPSASHKEAKEILEKGLLLEEEERQIAAVFYRVMMFHVGAIGVSYGELSQHVAAIKDGANANQRRPLIWHLIIDILGHVNYIYYSFTPDEQKKDGREIKNHRKRVLRRAAGIYDDYLSPFKFIRNAQAHFDEELDVILKQSKNEGKFFADMVLLGVDNVETKNTLIARSYDINNNILFYHGRKRCRLDTLNDAFSELFVTFNNNMAHRSTIHSVFRLATLLPVIEVSDDAAPAGTS